MTVHSVENSDLVAALEALGVRYLRAVAPVGSCAIEPDDLIASLACHPQPRFREALIPLFLRHPEYASFVQESVFALDAGSATTLRHMYTAAVYLQQMWQSTLSIYLGKFPLLPDYFGKTDFKLPAPEVYFGEIGLRALADQFQAKTGFDWWSTYQSVIHLFLAQLSLEKQHVSTG